MSSVWNIFNPIRTGLTNLKLRPSGREFYGTVIKHGLINKTVTVKVDYAYYNKKYKGYAKDTTHFLVHDEENFCVSGDKVVIRSCLPLSKRKHYYIRNVVKPFPRKDYYQQEINEQLTNEFQKLYQQQLQQELRTTVIKNKKDEAQLKMTLKQRALAKAMENLKKAENEKQQHKSASTHSKSAPQTTPSTPKEQKKNQTKLDQKKKQQQQKHQQADQVEEQSSSAQQQQPTQERSASTPSTKANVRQKRKQQSMKNQKKQQQPLQKLKSTKRSQQLQNSFEGQPPQKQPNE